MNKIKALALFSGGLDSILAARVVMAQGVEVEAIQFVTPFFHQEILDDIGGYRQKILSKYGVDVGIEDISESYLKMLRRPVHGFGKNFNPCVDCKIMMMRRARELMVAKAASFLISGEVVGQRPMSQRRDSLNVISRDSDVRSLLLRPLSAKLLPETVAEQKGWVCRNKLYTINGRGRSAQIALAAEFGISDYPAPAGGCILADPILSRRVKALYAGNSPLQEKVQVDDVRSLLVGRQLRLPSGGWLIIGRDERENDRLEQLAGPEDAILFMKEWPGPTALLKKAADYDDDSVLGADLRLAASLVVRYGRKIPQQDLRQSRKVCCEQDGTKTVFETTPFAEEEFREWIVG
ncbi:MAG: thiamine biosynthesis protein [Deltaproteobacteria bacterium]|nr:MAG: thiamine biosynthesis protein [Deltaproteobacteria bacterium]